MSLFVIAETESKFPNVVEFVAGLSDASWGALETFEGFQHAEQRHFAIFAVMKLAFQTSWQLDDFIVDGSVVGHSTQPLDPYCCLAGDLRVPETST